MNITSWVDTNIVTPATNYIKTRSYLNFNQNVDTIYDDSVDLGFCPPNENKQQSIKMEYLGTELYDIHTGKYAVNMLYADLTWKQHTHFNENKNEYNITRGLFGKIIDSNNIHFKYDVHFFTKFIKSNTSSINFVQNYDISNAKDYILQNRNEHTSLEFFGYFKSPNTGIYNIKITTGNDDAALLWLGDDALINYSMTNIISDNKSTSLAVKVVKDKYYPIRIQYGSQKNSNFTIEIVSDTNPSIGPIPDALSIDNYLYSINKSNVLYEPIQLCFSFIKTNDSDTLFRLMVSKYDINNNAEYNTLIRKSLSEPKVLYVDIPLFPAGLLSFQNSGNLILTDTNGNAIDLTKIPNYMSCQEGTNIANAPDIQLNNNTITPELTTNQTKNIDVNTGLPYTKFTYSGSGSKPSNPSDIYSANYVLGNTPKTNTFSSIPDINVNNLNKVAQCSFTLTLTNDGDIQINNKKKIIWTLFKGIIPNKRGATPITSPFAQVATEIKKAMSYSIVVRDWYDEYYNSYMNTQNSVMINTMNGGSNFTNSLIASNGKCKIMVDANGRYVFRYATHLPKRRQYITTDEYNSGLIYFFSARMDMKIGKTFLANSTDNSIQYIPTNGSILQYSSSYTKYEGKYPNPPNVLETGGNYLHWQNENTPCDIMCNKTNDCTHYYSYKTTDGATHCTINNDGTSARYYPKKPKDNIHSANLYIRDKIIKSDCNVNKFIQYDPKIKSVINGTTNTTTTPVSQENKYKYFKFDVLKNRGGEKTQISKITFYNNNNNVSFTEAVASSNTSSPSNETPSNAIGDNIKKKWLSYKSICSLYITFSNPITMNQYSITTANDVPDRDPISWNLYSSVDNQTWNLIDSKEKYPMPMNRFTQTPIININATQITPTPTTSTQLLNTSDSASAYDTYAINYSSYPTTTTEGPCGDPIINANIHSFLTTSGTQKEGFSSHITGGWQESFKSVCDSSNPNIEACRTELVNKVTSLQNNEAIIFNKNQEKINANYNELNRDINDYKTLSTKVNGPYDAIDHKGHLNYIYNDNNPSKYLEDIRFEDSKQQLLAENNLYIIGTIISATLLILTVISLTDQS